MKTAEKTKITIDKVWVTVESDYNYYLDYLITELDYEGNIVKSDQYSNDDIKKYGKKLIMGYIEDDKKRLKAFENNEWGFVGVVAHATVRFELDGWRLQTFDSEGIWGIESDSGEDFIIENIEGQLSNLKRHLEVFGVDMKGMPLKHGKMEVINK